MSHFRFSPRVAPHVIAGGSGACRQRAANRDAPGSPHSKPAGAAANGGAGSAPRALTGGCGDQWDAAGPARGGAGARDGGGHGGAGRRRRRGGGSGGGRALRHRPPVRRAGAGPRPACRESWGGAGWGGVGPVGRRELSRLHSRPRVRRDGPCSRSPGRGRSRAWDRAPGSPRGLRIDPVVAHRLITFDFFESESSWHHCIALPSVMGKIVPSELQGSFCQS